MNNALAEIKVVFTRHPNFNTFYVSQQNIENITDIMDCLLY